jgi:hypothetical protein
MPHGIKFWKKNSPISKRQPKVYHVVSHSTCAYEWIMDDSLQLMINQIIIWKMFLQIFIRLNCIYQTCLTFPAPAFFLHLSITKGLKLRVSLDLRHISRKFQWLPRVFGVEKSNSAIWKTRSWNQRWEIQDSSCQTWCACISADIHYGKKIPLATPLFSGSMNLVVLSWRLDGETGSAEFKITETVQNIDELDGLSWTSFIQP